MDVGGDGDLFWGEIEDQPGRSPCLLYLKLRLQLIGVNLIYSGEKDGQARVSKSMNDACCIFPSINPPNMGESNESNAFYCEYVLLLPPLSKSGFQVRGMTGFKHALFLRLFAITPMSFIFFRGLKSPTNQKYSFSSARRKTNTQPMPLAGGLAKSFGCAILNLGSATPTTWKAPQIVTFVWFQTSEPAKHCVNAHKYIYIYIYIIYLIYCLHDSSPCLIVKGPTFPLYFQNEYWANVILDGRYIMTSQSVVW